MRWVSIGCSLICSPTSFNISFPFFFDPMTIKSDPIPARTNRTADSEPPTSASPPSAASSHQHLEPSETDALLSYSFNPPNSEQHSYSQAYDSAAVPPSYHSISQPEETQLLPPDPRKRRGHGLAVLLLFIFLLVTFFFFTMEGEEQGIYLVSCSSFLNESLS